MGSFIGHAIPGSFFFMFGVWWLLQTMLRYFRCRQRGLPFRSTLTYNVRVCPCRRMQGVPVESLVKMVSCTLGIVVEIIGGINHESHRFDSVGNAQHITMYFFFALTGVFDILVAKKVAPMGSDYVSVMIALLVEGALFKFHLFGRTDLDVLVHVLLLYVIGFSAVLCAIEAGIRTTPVLPMLRSLLTMIQGTWFWALGVILYNPLPGAEPWDQGGHRSLMLAVVCFSWHIGVNLIIVMIVGGIVGFCYRRSAGDVRYTSLPLKALHEEGEEESECCPAVGGGRTTGAVGVEEYHDAIKPGANGRSLLSKQDGGGDDDSDMEFQAPIRK